MQLQETISGGGVTRYDVRSTRVGLIEPSRGGHFKKRCPCQKCFEWRRHTYTPKLLAEIQRSIRRSIVENFAISREIEGFLE